MRFSKEIIDWYHLNKRDLPWRKTADPYKIWLSEIILQQTRVDQGLTYYNKFIDQFPTIKDMANASESSILKLWQGLGYYSRARNLHSTARFIQEKHKGIFPNNYKDVIALKGVGEYTAAAISSFCYGLAHPVVDGNVYRLLSRYFGITSAIDTSAGKKEFAVLAEKLIDKKNPGIYNQAIMEFGALQCTPKSPDCAVCPLHTGCYAFHHNLIHALPFKEKRIKQSKRYFNYLVILDDDHIYINKRTKNDIWKNLYEFPLIETEQDGDLIQLMESKRWNEHFGQAQTNIISSYSTKHILTHQKIFSRFILLKSGSITKLPFKKVKLSNIEKYAVPKLIENYIQSHLAPFIKETV